MTQWRGSQWPDAAPQLWRGRSIGVGAVLGVLVAGLSLAVAGAVGTVQAQPAQPDDPTAAKAYAVFDRLCAECHQTGKLKTPVPAGGFGNILDLEALKKIGAWVRPGQPDASPLYTLMQMRTSPHDVDTGGRELDYGAPDLEAVRDWIQGLPPAPGCPDRIRVGRDDLEAAVAARLEAAGARADRLRFLSLAHAFNGCVPDADLAATRAAATLAVNSLSWSLQPVTLTPVGPSQTLLVVDLDAIGWSAERWERLARQDPYTATSPRGPALQRLADSDHPVVRADWFIATSLRGAAYIDLLGLPDRMSTLVTSLRIDKAAEVADGRARRIGIKTSAVARGSRLLQRHAFANGAYWKTYEYAPTPGRADIFDAPAVPGARTAPKADASLAVFSLPNGFNAFFMTNGDGLRVADLPQSVVRHDAHPRERLSAGAPCLACHMSGPQPATDELRARVVADAAVPKDVREKVVALHAVPEESARLMEADQRRVRAAMAAAGIATPPDLPAVIQRYQRAVTLEGLAAELGVSPVTLRAAAVRASPTTLPAPIVDTLQRVLHAPLPRKVIEAQAGALAQAVGQLRPGEAAPPPAAVEEDFGLILKTGPVSFKAGDLFAVTARVTQPCHLTLINVDRTGRGTVIFPNDFEPNNLVEPAKELRVPAEGAAYQFRLRDLGREAVIGICQATSKTPSGIRHDFERQRFTELGDYRAFLSRTLANEPAARAAQQKAEEQPRPKSNRRGRRVEAPAPPPARGEAQARAAVHIDILP